MGARAAIYRYWIMYYCNLGIKKLAICFTIGHTIRISAGFRCLMD
jgi:hypothetical protein